MTNGIGLFSSGKPILVLLFMFAAGTVLFAEQITVSRIKIECGDQIVSVEDRNPVPAQHWSVEPATVLSYLSFQPGDRLSVEDLERRVESSARRLLESGLFYDIRLGILPASNNPEERTVFIKMTPGFLWRFNAGVFFAGTGRKALLGGRNFLTVYGGYNLAGLIFTAENAGQADVLLGGGLLYRNSEPYGETFRQKGEAYFSGGFRFHPDISASVRISGSWDMDSANRPYLGLYPHADYLRYFGEEGQVSASAGWRFFIAEDGLRDEFFGDVRLEAPVWGIGDLLVLRYENRLPRQNPLESERPSLHEEFRGPLPAELQYAGAYYAGSLEYGMDAFKLFTASLSPAAVHPFVFCDIAGAAEAGESPFGADPAIAFGPGIKLIFDSPVFLTAVLTCGWNPNGEYLIHFTVKGEL